jgi:hypothetical protein
MSHTDFENIQNSNASTFHNPKNEILLTDDGGVRKQILVHGVDDPPKNKNIVYGWFAVSYF